VIHPLLAIAISLGAVAFACACGVLGYRWSVWRDRRNDERRGWPS
jgi:hypothetical protein